MPMHPSALAQSDLERLTGYSRAGDIERWCQTNSVRYFRGKAGVWTTLEAVNTALGLRAGLDPKPQKLEF